MRPVLVVGTRPEVVKMSPIVKALIRRKEPFWFVLTGQHHDYAMSDQFIQDLSLPKPTFAFQLTSNSPASQMGEMMTKLEAIFSHNNADVIVVQGDTNTMLSAALTGIKLRKKVAHVEAGLRSYDWRMSEEHNRRMVDHVSDMLFAPTEKAKQNLLAERVYGDLYVTGNTVIDAVTQHLSAALRCSHRLEPMFSEYALTTIHRAENVDSPEILKNLVDALVDSPLPIVFPVHPRTKLRLRDFGLLDRLSQSPIIQLLPPVGYLDMLLMMKNCRFILTDSGGLQEEATVSSIRKYVLVLRESTERTEALEAGFARIVGVKKDRIVSSIREVMDSPPPLPHHSPYGDGRAGETIVSILLGGE